MDAGGARSGTREGEEWVRRVGVHVLEFGEVRPAKVRQRCRKDRKCPYGNQGFCVTHVGQRRIIAPTLGVSLSSGRPSPLSLISQDPGPLWRVVRAGNAAFNTHAGP